MDRHMVPWSLETAGRFEEVVFESGCSAAIRWAILLAGPSGSIFLPATTMRRNNGDDTRASMAIARCARATGEMMAKSDDLRFAA
jgi:hypothetical protein